jgi:hypothetical protein
MPIGSASRRRATKRNASADGACRRRRPAGSALGGLGEEGQRRHPDQEAVAGHGVDPEGAAQRDGLGGRQPIDAVRHRPQQLVEDREGQLHLRLDAGGAQHTQPGRAGGRGLDEGGLPDAGLAAHDEHPAAAPADVLQELSEGLAFVLTFEFPFPPNRTPSAGSEEPGPGGR